MKKLAKKLLGISVLSTAIIPATCIVSSCGNEQKETELSKNYLEVSNFDDVKLVEPISGNDAKWDMTVSGSTSEERIKDAYKQLGSKYYDLISKNKNYFVQDLSHYIWKAIKGLKSSITDFQGNFQFKISNLVVAFDSNATHHFRTSFEIEYVANLTYNDYEYAKYEGYQTQVDLKGKFAVYNLYVDIHYQKYVDSVASVPTFEVYADPTLSTNPTTCNSIGTGKITYYNELGKQTTIDRDNESIVYDKKAEEVIEKAYYKDPIFCFAIYWYKVLSYSYSMDSYSLKNVTSKITK